MHFKIKHRNPLVLCAKTLVLPCTLWIYSYPLMHLNTAFVSFVLDWWLVAWRWLNTACFFFSPLLFFFSFHSPPLPPSLFTFYFFFFFHLWLSWFSTETPEQFPLLIVKKERIGLAETGKVDSWFQIKLLYLIAWQNKILKINCSFLSKQGWGRKMT